MTNSEWDAIERWEEMMFNWYHNVGARCAEEEAVEAARYEAWLDQTEAGYELGIDL